MGDFQVKIEKGQGLTQALKKYAQEQKEAGNAEISDGIFTQEEWNAAIGKLKDIQTDRQKNGGTSIFSGGTGNNWKKDMIVQEGEVEFSEAEMNQLMGAMGVSFKKKGAAAIPPAPIENKPLPSEVPKLEIKPLDVKLNEIPVGELGAKKNDNVKMKNVSIRVDGEKVDAVRVKDQDGKRYYQRTENGEIGEQVVKDKPRIARWFSKKDKKTEKKDEATTTPTPPPSVGKKTKKKDEAPKTPVLSSRVNISKFNTEQLRGLKDGAGVMFDSPTAEHPNNVIIGIKQGDTITFDSAEGMRTVFDPKTQKNVMKPGKTTYAIDETGINTRKVLKKVDGTGNSEEFTYDGLRKTSVTARNAAGQITNIVEYHNGYNIQNNADGTPKMKIIFGADGKKTIEMYDPATKTWKPQE